MTYQMMMHAMEKNEEEWWWQRVGGAGNGLWFLNIFLKKGLVEKVTLKQRFEGVDRVNRVYILSI